MKHKDDNIIKAIRPDELLQGIFEYFDHHIYINGVRLNIRNTSI